MEIEGKIGTSWLHVGTLPSRIQGSYLLHHGTAAFFTHCKQVSQLGISCSWSVESLSFLKAWGWKHLDTVRKSRQVNMSWTSTCSKALFVHLLPSPSLPTHLYDCSIGLTINFCFKSHTLYSGRNTANPLLLNLKEREKRTQKTFFLPKKKILSELVCVFLSSLAHFSVLFPFVFMDSQAFLSILAVDHCSSSTVRYHLYVMYIFVLCVFVLDCRPSEVRAAVDRSPQCPEQFCVIIWNA